MRTTSIILLLAVVSTSALAQPGTLDETFGTGGVVLIDITSNADIGTDMLPMADGRLLVCGYTEPSPIWPEPFILRLLPDGTLDPNYGIVMLSDGDKGHAEKMVFAADSSVYLCGYADTLGYDRFTLWHLLPDGTPDPAFGLNGRVSFPLTGITDLHALDIAMQPDGKLVVAGYYRVGTRSCFLARFNTDGAIDSTFALGGGLGMDNSDNANDEFLTVDVLDDGSIVTGGYGTSGGQAYPLIVKFTPAGALDITFDGDGILTPTLNVPQAWVTCLAAVGQDVVASGARYTGLATTSDYFLIRFDDTGVLDPSFGTLGEQVTDVDADDFIRDLTILPDGRIALAGYTGDATNGTGYIDFLTAVHSADGAPYTTFGGSGYALAALSTHPDEAHAVKAQPDGKLVVSGTSKMNSSNYVVTILRYENDVLTTVPFAEQTTDLMAWPNPANDQLRLHTTQNGAARVEILDACGRIVRSLSTTHANEFVIPVADLQPGKYLLRCMDERAVRVLSFHIAR